MSLSRKSAETLIDLVEIKMSCIIGFDRKDVQTLAMLEKCLSELKGYAEGAHEPQNFRLTRAL